MLCFLRPVFCASPITAGTDQGEERCGGAMDLKALPPCLFPWGCEITGPRSAIFLMALNLSERLAVLA